MTQLAFGFASQRGANVAPLDPATRERLVALIAQAILMAAIIVPIWRR